MKVGIVAVVGATLFAGGAMAADLPARMPVKAAPYVTAYNWTGFYIGAHAGYGWGTSSWDPVPFVFQGSHHMNGGLVGGQVGYNWQAAGSPWVFGLEGEGSWSSIKGSHLDPTATLLDTRVRAMGTVAGRVGYAMNNTMLYAKGGAAFADFRYNDSFGGVLNGRASNTRTGWLVGAGVEYGFAANWSTKIEYNYADFGRDSVTMTGGAAPAFIENIKDHVNVVKVGVNYRFR